MRALQGRLLRGPQDRRGRLLRHAARRGARVVLGLDELADPFGDRARSQLDAGTRGDRIEAAPELRRACEPVIAVALERGEDQPVEVGWARRVVRRRRGDLCLADLAHRLEVSARGEQGRRGHQLPRDDAHREHVGDRAELHAERRLGRHVAELAFDLPALGVELATVRLRDAEVDHLHVAGMRDDDVRRRDVAVDDPQRHTLLVEARVCVLERVAHLADERQHDRERDRFVRAVRVPQHLA